MNTDVVKEKAAATIRPRCPFYGFSALDGMFVDCHGNGCGVHGGHSPCAMEMVNETPDWEMCRRFNHERNRIFLEQILDHCKIFPEELKPRNTKEWEGVSMRGWFQLIMR